MAEEKNKKEINIETKQELTEREEKQIEDDVSEEEEQTMKLPFPNAAVVRMIRANIDPGKQIKKQVKVELNKFLGAMVKKIAKKMNQNPYSYVDYGMLREAIEVYERMNMVEAEKDRIIKYLEKIKSDCDLLEREVENKFKL